MKLTPKQLGIAAAMSAIEFAFEHPDQHSATDRTLGVAQRRGMRKELALIHSRLGKRLPENCGFEWTELPVDNGE